MIIWNIETNIETWVDKILAEVEICLVIKLWISINITISKYGYHSFEVWISLIQNMDITNSNYGYP